MLCYLEACRGSLEVKEAVLGIALLVRLKSLPDARNLMYSIAEVYPHARQILEDIGFGLAERMAEAPSLVNKANPKLNTLESFLILKVPRMASERKRKLMVERDNFRTLGFGVDSLVNLADVMVPANCYVCHDFMKNHVLRGVYTESYSIFIYCFPPPKKTHLKGVFTFFYVEHMLNPPLSNVPP